jgi:CRISPR-associated protein (TIGR02584 family)
MKQFKEILVCVIGATPQIITETIYALAHKNPSIYINEIFIITTSTGKKQIEETLIKKGIFKKLIKEYKFPSLEIKPSSIIVIKDTNGKEIET